MLLLLLSTAFWWSGDGCCSKPVCLAEYHCEHHKHGDNKVWSIEEHESHPLILSLGSDSVHFFEIIKIEAVEHRCNGSGDVATVYESWDSDPGLASCQNMRQIMVIFGKA